MAAELIEKEAFEETHSEYTAYQDNLHASILLAFGVAGVVATAAGIAALLLPAAVGIVFGVLSLLPAALGGMLYIRCERYLRTQWDTKITNEFGDDPTEIPAWTAAEGANIPAPVQRTVREYLASTLDPEELEVAAVLGETHPGNLQQLVQDTRAIL